MDPNESISMLISALSNLKDSLSEVSENLVRSIRTVDSISASLNTMNNFAKESLNQPTLIADLTRMQLACLGSLTGECWRKPNLISVLNNLETTARECVAKAEAANRDARQDLDDPSSLDLTDLIYFQEKGILRKYSILGTSRRGTLQHPRLGIIEVGVGKPPPGDTDEDQDTRLRNRREDIEFWASLRHPNIMAVLGTCILSIDGVTELCPVYRWMGFRDLKALIVSGKPFDALKVLKGPAQALKYLHGRGLAYGQLKTNAFMLTEDGVAILRTFRTKRSLVPTDARRGVIYSRVA